ncbi:hypothetical protein LTS12_027846, partial [Elasticomyces elasticus]
MTSHATHPILYWDIELGHGLPLQDVRAHCHQFQAFRMQQDLSGDDLSATVTQNLLFSFADVICIFAEDVGGLAGVLSYLKSWVSRGYAATKYSFAARLIVVVSHDTSDLAGLEEAEFLENSRTFGLTRAYRSLSVQHVSTQPLRNARYLVLRGTILDSELASAREDRGARMCLYTGTHLVSIFSQALAHTAKNSSEPFDWLAATRHGIPQLPYFSDCLAALLRASTREGVPHGTITSILATSLLMQAYPPKCH